jgi:hypothetical protein
MVEQCGILRKGANYTHSFGRTSGTISASKIWSECGRSHAVMDEWLIRLGFEVTLLHLFPYRLLAFLAIRMRSTNVNHGRGSKTGKP